MKESPSLKAAVLTVGDELTCGYRLDTNSQTISRRLATVPLEVELHLTVGDDAESIRSALSAALDVADIVIVTGGLGPTEDDLTRQAVAAYFGLDLVEDAEALARIRKRLTRGGRSMSDSSRAQARVPAGSQIIQNDRGTAPGFYLQHAARHLFVTPGIPYEMKGMLEEFILPRLRELASAGRHVRRAAVKVYGLPESEINERIQPMLARGRNPVLGLLPHRGTITVEVVAVGENPAQAKSLLAADLAALREQLEGYIVNEDERSLPQVVTDLLVERGLTIATAELGTGGLVAARLSGPEGAQRWFRRSLVFGSAREATGTARGQELSRTELALTMARAIREAADADVGVGVGEIWISPDSARRQPWGEVSVAVILGGREVCRSLRLNGDRELVRDWAADASLALVREWVLNVSGDENWIDIEDR
ncbi:MAG: molybdopterin-binding protein [Anaerolineae bacterium]|jgi:nicotinamide-nucleotide amidase